MRWADLVDAIRQKRKIVFFLFSLFLFSISACGIGPVASPTKLPTSTNTPNSDLIQDFVGIYRKVRPKYDECNLEISRDSTFKLTFSNLINGITVNVEGIISYSEGQFWLTRTKADPNVDEDYACFPRALIPIYWQDRRYLFMNIDKNDGIFDSIVSMFCDDLKKGKEPRDNIDDIYGIYFVRENDLTIKVTGFPVQIDGKLFCP